MPMEESRKQYLKEYKKNCLKRIPFEIPTELYERVKIAAEFQELSVNRYIRHALEQDLKQLDYRIDKKLAEKRHKEKSEEMGRFLFSNEKPTFKEKKVLVPDPEGKGMTVKYIRETES